MHNMHNHELPLPGYENVRKSNYCSDTGAQKQDHERRGHGLLGSDLTEGFVRSA